MSVPTYLYKIVPSSSPLPSPLPDILPPSDLDKKDGFIHLSSAKQIPGTLRLVFKDDTKVYILKIGYAKLEKDVKWEEGSCVPGASEGDKNPDSNGRCLTLLCSVTKGDMFPHLYNELRLKREEIESIAEWEKDTHGWDGAVNKAKEDGWLTF
jgi:uncharacterized protein (DUF952 family)